MIGRKTLVAVALVIGLFVGFILITFPGRQAPLALTLTTGWNMPALQARIDALEEAVIHDQPLAEDDPAFLKRLYTTGRKIGSLTRAAPQTARLLQRWLDATGDDLQLPGRFFLTSRRVRDRMDALRGRNRSRRQHPGWPASRIPHRGLLHG